MVAIEPTAIRYIKQGAGDRWVGRAFADQTLEFGFPGLPHSLCLNCLAADKRGEPDAWAPVTKFFRDQEGKSAGKASDNLREVRDFYTLGADCLWVTIAQDCVWWCFAEPGVCGRENADLDIEGSRYRRVIGGWKDSDLSGVPLSLDRLSSRLTKVAAYRQTICRIGPEDYLLRKINAVIEPIIEQAEHARTAMQMAAAEMISSLHWADFETLVDLMFARTGWQRVSRIGGTMKDADLILEQLATGEKALVQVKSRADQHVLEDYVSRFERSERYDWLFFICHTTKGALAIPPTSSVRVWEKQGWPVS